MTFSDAAAKAQDVTITSPSGASNAQLAGQNETVTSKVTDQYGAPVSGAKVTFVADGGTPQDTSDDLSTTQTTDSNGVASFTYKRNSAIGTETVTASTPVKDAQGQAATATDSVDVTWSEGVATVNGESYPTIQDAINSSNTKPGDTITAVGKFAPTSEITVSKDVTINGGGSATVSSASLDLAHSDAVFKVSAPGATVQGFKITSTGVVGVSVASGTTGVTVSGNTITGNDTKAGVYFDSGTTGTVSNNTISATKAAVSAATTGAMSVTGNTLKNNAEGVGVAGLDTTISGNTFTTDTPASDVYVRWYNPVPTTTVTTTKSANTFDPAANVGTDNGDQALLPTGSTVTP